MVDTRLIGDWHGKLSDGDGSAIFRFTSTKNGWMHLDVLPDKPDERQDSYDFFASTIGQDQFLDLVMPDTKVSWYSTNAYALIRYQIRSGHTLQMWQMSQDKAAAAVRAGKVKGLIHQDKKSFVAGDPLHPDIDVMLTDSVSNLSQFIQQSNLAELFNQGMPPLHRVTPDK